MIPVIVPIAVVAGGVILACVAAIAWWARRPDPLQQPTSSTPGPAPAAPEPTEAPTIPDATPATWKPTGNPDAWEQLAPAAGLALVRPRRRWTTPPVASVLRRAGQAAALRGGALQVAEIAGETRGAPLPPHVSHRYGRDVDVGYTLDTYPTPINLAPSADWLAVMAEIRPWIEVIGVGSIRARQLAGEPIGPYQPAQLEQLARERTGLPIAVWPDHIGHAHVRLVRSLTAEPRA